MKERLLVDEGAQGTRLDVFLAREKTRFSRSHIQKLIEGASVLVNGKAIGTWKLKNKKMPIPLYTMFEGIKQPRKSMILQAIEEFSLRFGMGKDMML